MQPAKPVLAAVVSALAAIASHCRMRSATATAREAQKT
jgi:hypothetical protein